MKMLSSLVLLIPLLVSQRALAAPADVVSFNSIQCPAEAGVYLTRAGGWKRVEEVRSIETAQSGQRLSALTYGLRPAGTRAIFAASRAPIKTKSSAALFCAVGLTDEGRDLRVVKLEPGRGVRAMEIKIMRANGGNTAEHNDVNEKHRVFVDFRKLDERTFILQAPVDLRAGEYVLLSREQLDRPDRALTAYDFSVDAEGLLRGLRF